MSIGVRDYFKNGEPGSDSSGSYSLLPDYDDDSLFLGEDSGDGNNVSLRCGIE